MNILTGIKIISQCFIILCPSHIYVYEVTSNISSKVVGFQAFCFPFHCNHLLIIIPKNTLVFFSESSETDTTKTFTGESSLTGAITQTWAAATKILLGKKETSSLKVMLRHTSPLKDTNEKVNASEKIRFMFLKPSFFFLFCFLFIFNSIKSVGKSKIVFMSIIYICY